MAKKILTKKQKLIILLIYSFRFLNSKQIQEFLKHKDHRRINTWLKDLAEKEYIIRDFTPRFGTLTKPAVCYLGALGRKNIRHGYAYYFPTYLKRIAQDKTLSKAFRIRCQIIADWYLMLIPPMQEGQAPDGEDGKGTEKRLKSNIKRKTGIAIIDELEDRLTTNVSDEEEKIPFNRLQFFTSAYFPTFTPLETIKPDAVTRKRTRQGITYGFLFVLDAYVPRLFLRYLIQRIFKALDEEYWEEDCIHSLEFYILCPNNIIIIYFKRLLPSFLERYYGGKPLLFHFATRNQLYKKKNGQAEIIGWVTFNSADY